MHQISLKETYKGLIKENLILISNIIENENKEIVAFNPNELATFYSSRAKHIQVMTLLGYTAEQLIKYIVLSRGFSIEEVDYVRKMKDIPEVKFSSRVISFNKALQIFSNSNEDNYFENVGSYNFNNNNASYVYEYMGCKNIEPSSCLNLIQKIRNNYVHNASAHNEMQGIIWYIYNFILWLAKKECGEIVSNIKFIGNNDIVKLFE